MVFLVSAIMTFLLCASWLSITIIYHHIPRLGDSAQRAVDHTILIAKSENKVLCGASHTLLLFDFTILDFSVKPGLLSSL